jgi:exopolysaccharide biosynthesis polyprenyl glycosylphosphotransferase
MANDTAYSEDHRMSVDQAVEPRRQHPVDVELLLRSRISRREVGARFVLLWIVAYVALRSGASIPRAAGQAMLVAIVWLLVGQRVAQTFRAMTFAVGAFAVAVTTSIVGVLAVSAVGYWIPSMGISHHSLAIVALATALAAGLWERLIRRTAPATRRVMIVGGGPPTARFLSDLANDPGVAFKVVAIVDDAVDESIAREVPYGGRLEDLPLAIRRFSPDLVVIAVSTGRPTIFARLLEVADEGFQVAGLPEVYEFAFGRLPVGDLTSAWFMSIFHAYQRPSNRLAKRTFDVVVASVGLVVTLPLLPLILVLVKRTRGPLLYRQTRLGEHGRVFTMLKFRSMRVDAEEAGQAQWASTNDPRVIPGGRLLRLLRFDELPQLWNVLRGEMSIVGPRPERPEFVDHLKAEVPFWTQRHLLKPGITGWAQIRAGYAADALGTAEKLSYDLWYLRHRSIILDTTICLKTFPRMALFRGAR